MSKRVMAICLAFAGLAAASPAGAGSAPSLIGPNSDFSDAHLVMPFDATSPRTSFFAASNVGAGSIDAQWFFYDASGELIAQVTRTILGEGGTDIVDVTRIADRTHNGDGFQEGPSRSLAGRRGFAVVVGDGEPRLIGSFSIASTATNAAFGASAAGFGQVGALNQAGPSIAGTSFSPASLQDNVLILIGLNPAAGGSVTSLTDGDVPAGPEDVMRITIELHGNSGDGLIATGTFGVRGSALFSSLQNLFPGVSLTGSLTVVAYADEGPGYSDDPDGDAFIPLMGFYGQTLGPFGTGQNLRTLQ